MKVKKHHLTPTEGKGRGINGHSAFYCSINDIIVESNNDILGDKWYIGQEGSDTIWYPTPTVAAIAYYDTHHS